MYDPVTALQIDRSLAFRHGKTFKGVTIVEPEEEQEEQEDKYREKNQKYLNEREESREVRAEQCEQRLVPYAKARKKPPKPVKYKWTGDARERRDAKIYAGQVEREGTLTPRQTEMVTDLANGLMLRSIATKHGLTTGGVIYHIREARERLGAISNPNLIKIAVERKLI